MFFEFLPHGDVRCWTGADSYLWAADGDFAISHSAAESGCSGPGILQVGVMSLNRCEQMFFDHLSQRAEERQYWQGKVRSHLGGGCLNHYSITALERELWAEFVEKSRVVKEFGAWLESGGGQRTSMRNLAEHLARLWLPPVVRKPPPPGPLFQESP